MTEKKPERRLIQVDMDELACRLAEALYDTPRPEGVPPERALLSLCDDHQQVLSAAAKAAFSYIVFDCLGVDPDHIRKVEGAGTTLQ